ncbi:hypothetical protein [Halorussus caseinilyticus]|uniref:30S ribosomal protein S27e n=1 Tax=Halorussus caseinilyticus TaxID=3034025 RepID=A0ABD5WNM9_9EURY|nr:hypothetical protein [Halorussus sp. DT72]
MGRYPRKARGAQVKCIECNAPVVKTIDGRFACVSCGSEPLSERSDPTVSVSEDTASPADD